MEPAAVGLWAEVLSTVRHGGPIAIVVAILCVSGLLALVVWSLPAAARPLADAFATVRGGATQREDRLAKKVQVLEETVRQLLHHEEEQRRLMAAMLDRMECEVPGCAMPELREMFATLVANSPGPAAVALLASATGAGD